VTRDTQLLHQAAARCLAYPDGEFHADVPLLRAALAPLRGGPADTLRLFLEQATALTPAALAEHYVRVFDFGRRACLYLTWWTDGDTRRRGGALVRFKEHYRAHGFTWDSDELPDFLPAVLEFAAASGSDALLREHRPALELLRLGLAEDGTPYAHVLDAVCATLPGPSARDRAAALALAAGGPPTEEVGLATAPYGHLRQLPLLTGGRR